MGYVRFKELTTLAFRRQVRSAVDGPRAGGYVEPWVESHQPSWLAGAPFEVSSVGSSPHRSCGQFTSWTHSCADPRHKSVLVGGVAFHNNCSQISLHCGPAGFVHTRAIMNPSVIYPTRVVPVESLFVLSPHLMIDQSSIPFSSPNWFLCSFVPIFTLTSSSIATLLLIILSCPSSSDQYSSVYKSS